MNLSKLEQALLAQGLSGLSPFERNELIIDIAQKEGIRDYNQITDEVLLNHHKKLKADYLVDSVEQDILGGFTSDVNGHSYRTNRDDQINMIGQKDELTADETIATVMWKTEDAGYVEHTREDWLLIYREAFSNKKAKLMKYNTLKEQSSNATTDAELVAVQW